MLYPSRDEARRLTSDGNYIPVFCEVLADTETPLSAFHKIAYNDQAQRAPYAFLLESVEGGENIGRYSFLGVEPNAIFVQNGDAAAVYRDGKVVERMKGEDCFTLLSNYLKRYKQVKIPGLAPFNGGAVGYASFETIEQIEPSVKCPEDGGIGADDAVFLITDTLLAFDRVKHKIQVISHVDLTGDMDFDQAYDQAEESISELIAKLRAPGNLPLPLRPLVQPEPLPYTSNVTEKEFHDMVLKAKDYIVEGDIIQVVLSQRFEAETDLEPIELHRALRTINPSPYMFCLHLDDLALCGTSPEIHARCEEGKMTVRPIAGTRTRGNTIAEDNALAQELLADPKERAEHIMLVDLARNDLGRIAETGTVAVENLMVVERYSHVMHIVSDVVADLKEGLPSSVTMSSTFPAGTVSGAPKIRAMQIIAELEQKRRGPYAGTVAYFSFDGNVDSCITIRTVALKNGKAYIQAGAGIVADSDPAFEFEETRNKAKAMMVALAAAEQISQS